MMVEKRVRNVATLIIHILGGRECHPKTKADPTIEVFYLKDHIIKLDKN